MLRIPLLRRQPKPDSPQGEDGRKTALPGLPADRQMMHPFVTEDAEKALLSRALPEQSGPWLQAEDKDVPPSSPQDSPPDIAELPLATEDAAGEPVPAQSQVLSENEPSSLVNDEDGEVSASSDPDGRTDQMQSDALAIVRAMPDYIFRIGRDGVLPAVGDGSIDGAGMTTSGPESDDSRDSQAAASGEDKPRTLEKVIIEELWRQSQEQTAKVRETGQVQTFDIQIHDGRQSYHFEVRLTAFGENEVLALVRDVTLLRQTQNALIESRNELENHLKDRNVELIRMNKMLKMEADLRLEEEGMLRKSFSRLEKLLDDTIEAITAIVEKKDPYMIGHQQRVSQLSCAIGREMALGSDRLRAIRIAALLHDMGKIFIPAEILRKPGKLSQAETSVVKTHPDANYEILKKIDFSGSIADIVRQHHERMDGSGYPLGLKGEAILMEARIIGVADVIEAMVTNRPYRPALGEEAALKEIADKKGILYDPAVVDSCLKLFAEQRFKFEPLTPQESSASGGGAWDRSRGSSG
jgi:HD-GYP domain-containing protein (c-di-GMP phosphodiesterase class II)